MQEKHREIIKLWGNQVWSKISYDEISELNIALQKKNTILALQSEEFQHLAENISHEKAIAYLTDRLCCRGSKAFGEFCIALQITDQSDLCEELTKIARNHGFPDFVCQRIWNVALDPGNCDCYDVCSEPRGHVLVLNNTFSHNKEKERRGSARDVQRLQRVFQDLHYEVHVRNDLTREEMTGELEDFAEKEYHLNCGAAGVVIMSHGSFNGLIYDDNDQPVHINDLLRPLKSDISHLLKKPVFVVVQACRGSQLMNGLVDLSKVLNDSVPLEADVNPAEEMLEGMTLLKNWQDIIIVYSCLPTFISGRDPTEGAIFMQAFCEVLREHGATITFTDLIILVSDKDSEYQLKNQLSSAVVPQVANFLTKKFFLSTKYF